MVCGPSSWRSLGRSAALTMNNTGTLSVTDTLAVFTSQTTVMMIFLNINTDQLKQLHLFFCVSVLLHQNGIDHVTYLRPGNVWFT